MTPFKRIAKLCCFGLVILIEDGLMTTQFTEEPLASEELKVSPMMGQWQACKNIAKDAILLFRLGDFYEAFHEDAALLAKELDLTLTRRQEIPMSGIPFHASDAYIDKLVAKGYRVAIAEQVEEASKAKGLVKREIVRVVTPGTVINSHLISDKSNNFFICLHETHQTFGLACLDLTTGEFRVSEFDQERDLFNELYRLHPSEFLVSARFKTKHQTMFDELKQTFNFLLNTQEDWRFEQQSTRDFLLQHFKVYSLDGFGLQDFSTAIAAAGALLYYLQDALCLAIQHIQDIRPYSTTHFMSLDRISQRNLELTASLKDGGRKHTLLDVLDRTCTPMGGRLLRHWIKQPLLSIPAIQQRQDGVQAFLNAPGVLQKLQEWFIRVRDLERLMMKISAGYATPRDLMGLYHSFLPIADIKTLLSSLSSQVIQDEIALLDPLPAMTNLLARALADEPPLRIGEGKIFRDGFHAELDELREMSRDSKNWLARYQTTLREQTGIKTLKVGFNRMFGYYIEVSRGQADKMPDSFNRRQTLVNAERYISPELKEYESKILTAEERMNAIESELFTTLRQEISQYAKTVIRVAQSLARLDCLKSLAEVARDYHYTRPLVDEGLIIQIEEGRHPVIESTCLQEKFIPNDTWLDPEENRLILITGPNMAGKSTYLRQVALIVILAQIGSFVPAKQAHIGAVDKIFTRIGASDDLSRGQSTFMVEMTETANILHNATNRSLVILDEIGRGTSTYDGISIAWSVAEFLLTAQGRKAKTLFATHYWELTKLEEKVSGAVNYHVAVHETEETIIFLRKIIRGSTDKSYGIHVARLAGLPAAVISRAKEILVHLEENANRKETFAPTKPKRSPALSKVNVPHSDLQLSLFSSRN